MKKILFTIVFCLVFMPLAAKAEVDSNFTSTTQFLTNIGYSPDVGRIAEVHLTNPYAPIEKKTLTNKEKVFRTINYLFPTDYDDWDFPHHKSVQDHTWFTDY